MTTGPDALKLHWSTKHVIWFVASIVATPFLLTIANGPSSWPWWTSSAALAVTAIGLVAWRRRYWPVAAGFLVGAILYTVFFVWLFSQFGDGLDGL